MTADLARLLKDLDRDDDEKLSFNYVIDGEFRPEITTVGEAPALAAGHTSRDCYYGTGALHSRVTTGRGDAVDVTGVRELFADLDVKVGGMKDYAAAEAVIAELSRMLRTNPVAVVHSGHGLQPHWLIERGTPGTDWTDETSPEFVAATALVRRWGRLVAHVAEQHGGHVDNVYDLSRVLRVPGTTNTKGSPVKVTIEFSDGSPSTLAHVLATLDAWGVQEQAEDTERLGTIVSEPGDWTFAEKTCGYVKRMIAGWVTDTVMGRHPWLVCQCVRLAAAHRHGCITEADYQGALVALRARFRVLLDRRTDRRKEQPGEVAGALSWGVTKVSTFDAARVGTELGNSDHGHAATQLRDPGDDFWESRPELAHVRRFAHGRLACPLATLAIVLARVVTATPFFFALPPLIGGDASLNLFVAVVAISGHGKGASHAAAHDAVTIEGVHQLSLGSGEGIARSFGHREKAPDGGSVIVRDRDALLFNVAEVDTLTALGSRQGATLLPQVRQAYSGESLGFAYADPAKAVIIEGHQYRLCLILGVQPGKAGPLLDDADGGTPQRFLWVPGSEGPGAPSEVPTTPAPMTWAPPTLSVWAPANPSTGRRIMGVPEVARKVVIKAAQERNQGEVAALDGHAVLTRLKVAAALALFAGRTSIDDEDWQLAGHLMEVSDRTRAGVVATLAARNRTANKVRGEMEGHRAVAAEEVVSAAQRQRVARNILKALRKRDGWATLRDVTHSVTSRDRACTDEALTVLIGAGQIEARDDDGKAFYRVVEAA